MKKRPPFRRDRPKPQGTPRGKPEGDDLLRVGGLPAVQALFGRGAARVERLFFTPERRRDAERLAAQGYVPVAQSWSPGGRGLGDFLLACILSLTVIGLLAWIWILAVPAQGSLLVTWQRAGALPIGDGPGRG